MNKAESSGGNASQVQMGPVENQIVVYQPNETVRLDVRLENETVWLTQSQMATLFGCSTDNVGLHLKNIYSCGELDKEATTEESSVVQIEGRRKVSRKVCLYNLDAIISVGYRVNSILMDRRLAKHDSDIADLKEKVDFFVQTQTPPLQGVFYDGQLWDARALVLKLVAGAKRSLILIDNWANTAVLDLFTKKREGVRLTIFTSEHYDRNHVPHCKISSADIATFNVQYPKLAVRYNETFHDRFLIIDDKELYVIGASLKDLGSKCFAFTKLAPADIRRIKKTAFHPTPRTNRKGMTP